MNAKLARISFTTLDMALHSFGHMPNMGLPLIKTFLLVLTCFIFLNLGDWVTPFNNSANTTTGNKSSETGTEKSKDEEKKEEDESTTADPETAASYIIHLLPLFVKSYQTSMVSSVKKAILGLIRKMIFYSTGDNLQELAKLSGFASGLVEVIAAVFENEVGLRLL